MPASGERVTSNDIAVGSPAVPWTSSRLAGDAPDVAPRLLNAVILVGGCAGRIVEVEAYGGADDPASHAHRGRRRANASMFAPAGTLYVYRSYGIHCCANVVTGPREEAAAVLVRAVEPVAGLDSMRVRRPGVRRVRDLVNGPGKLCAALDIGLDHDGIDLLDSTSAVRLVHDGTPPPPDPVVSTRVGISRGTDRLHRWMVPDSAYVSKGRPSGG